MATRRKQVTFVRHAKADERRRSALDLVAVIAPMAIDDAIKRKMLSHCLWFVTETDGASKYRTRYMSRAAIGKQAKSLHHEHVFRRKDLVAAMMADPARAAEIAATALGCTVTRKEHDLLTAQDKASPGLIGWNRYFAAGIDVIDTVSGNSLQGPPLGER